MASIGTAVFAQSGLTSIEIPSTVTSIGDQAFYLCDELTTVTFRCGPSPITISSDAFDSSGMISIALPSDATYTGSVTRTTLTCSSVGDDCSSDVLVCNTAGMFCDTTDAVGSGANTCQLAQPGYYASGSGMQIACPLGSFSSVSGSYRFYAISRSTKRIMLSLKA